MELPIQLSKTLGFNPNEINKNLKKIHRLNQYNQEMELMTVLTMDQNHLDKELSLLPISKKILMLIVQHLLLLQMLQLVM